MVRSSFVALAVIALVCSTTAAFAGGSSRGSSKSSLQSVRIKNIGSQPVIVNAANGGSVGLVGAKTVSPNGVAQFRLKKVASSAIAATTSLGDTDRLQYTFKNRQTVYLEAVSDSTLATMTFAPPGKLF